MTRAMAGNGLMFQNEVESRLQNHYQGEAGTRFLPHGSHDARVDWVPIRCFRTRLT
jgi:hypothetical protein